MLRASFLTSGKRTGQMQWCTPLLPGKLKRVQHQNQLEMVPASFLSSSLISLAIVSHSDTHTQNTFCNPAHAISSSHAVRARSSPVWWFRERRSRLVLLDEGERAGLVQLGNRGPMRFCKFYIFVITRLSAHPGKEHCLDKHSSLHLGTPCGSLMESINNPILPHPIPEPTEKHKGSKQMENTNLAASLLVKAEWEHAV